MDAQNAVYCLKAMSENNPEVCEECPLYGQTGTDHCSEEALHIAIKALEKQIAKKPIIKSMWSVAKCPCCGTELGEYVNEGYPKNWESLKFCDCGQRLNWEDSEV